MTTIPLTMIPCSNSACRIRILVSKQEYERGKHSMLCPDCSRTEVTTTRSVVVDDAVQPNQSPREPELLPVDGILAKYAPPDPVASFDDIKRLIEQASTPIEYRSQTFWEWWNNVDLEAAQVEQKLRAGNYADQLLSQRLELIRKMQEIAKTAFEAAQAQSEARQKLLVAYRDQMRLEGEIVQEQALRAERLKTLQLEQEHKNAQLMAALNPPPALPPAPVETDEDRAQQVVDRHLLEFRTRASMHQRVISDFLKEVRSVYDSSTDDTEKALRIRAVMQTYRRGEEALPIDVRKFLDLVEDDEVRCGTE
jgi:hypothetical protein